MKLPITYGTLPGDKRGDGSTWGATGFWDADQKLIIGTDDGWGCDIHEPTPEQREKILRALNDHDKLVAALQRLHDECCVTKHGRLNAGPMLEPSEGAVLAARKLLEAP